MKIKYLAIILMILSANIFAQNFLGVLSYSTAMPMDKTKEYISDFSWKGFSFEGRTFTNRNWSFGGVFGWNIFDAKITDLVEIDEGTTGITVKGTQIRYTNVFPLMFTGHHHFGKRKSALRPYLGLGIGTYYIIQKFEIGVFQREVSNWHFGLAPEAGVLLALSRNTSMILSLKYNYAFSARKSVFGDTDNSHSYIGINIGLAFYGY
ncbi:MAG: OmpW family outer membrane protein [Bacteroidota bacterium]